jgi:hypothetical protein
MFPYQPQAYSDKTDVDCIQIVNILAPLNMVNTIAWSD